MSLLNVLNIASSALHAQSKKISVSACNLANSDSMVYKNGKLFPYTAKEVILKFRNINNSSVGGVTAHIVKNKINPFKIIYNPSHPMANSKGYVKIPNINPIQETINSISAARNYQANIEVINTVKNIIIKTLTIGQ